MQLSTTFIFPILALGTLSTVNAVDIHGQARRSCATGEATVAICNNIPTNVCCLFPVGGLIAAGAYFSILQDCDIGAWYDRTSSDRGCATVRDARSGPVNFLCLTGAARPGGGAAWFDLIANLCNARKQKRLEISDVELAAQAGNCTGTMQATVLAYEGEGAWVLEPGSEAYEAYEKLPATEDLDEHLSNMKALGTWYQSVDDHPAALAALKRSNDVDQGPAFQAIGQ
ncbi:hypothetical protein DL98DRAFT_652129 [Cadophora sp. DSE1049]|nr:hypothetical protein DL98DRAFT_652129 [Cadophora sp. DSE1049]